MKKEIEINSEQRKLINEYGEYRFKMIDIQEEIEKTGLKQFAWSINIINDKLMICELYYPELLTQEEAKILDFENRQIREKFNKRNV